MSDNKRSLGTFDGVFTPTILTILGVIMYLRMGWVVGNAGFGGAILIIVLAKIITISTGFSISSMATNSKVGAGGFYSLISRSLGLEVGSAVGIPLFLSQALGGALYIVGFTEAWLAIFPLHSAILVSVSVLSIAFIISIIGAQFAMRSQYLIMAIISLSLLSLFLGATPETIELTTIGSFPNASFWTVFAIFFPAVTGISAGAAMSGELKDPGKSLPLGILSAIGIGFVIYVAVAFWLDRLATTEQLLTNNVIMFQISRWHYLIVAGVLGATFSSALGSILGAPRTLMAMGQDKAIPFHKTMSKTYLGGEPIPALIFTFIIILVCLLLADLDTIAPLLTMFFLVTYTTINVAVAIENGLGIPSFRPRFKTPLWVSIIGAIWGIIVMFLIDPLFAGVAWILVLIFYIIQIKRRLLTPWGDIRIGIFNAIAEWGARKVSLFSKNPKTWKPNVMVPIEDPQNWPLLMNFLRDLVFPSGTIRLFSVRLLDEGVHVIVRGIAGQLFGKRFQEKEQKRIQQAEIEVNTIETQLENLLAPVQAEGLLATSTVIECNNFLEGMSIITQVMRGMHFPPNMIFLTLSFDNKKDDKVEEMITIAVREKLGIVIFSQHPRSALGHQQVVNIWLRMSSPNKDLTVLLALQLKNNWRCKLCFITVVSDESQKDNYKIILERLIDRTRMPSDTESLVLVGDFAQCLREAPVADLNIFGLSNELNANIMHDLADNANTSCLFIRDGGDESMVV